MKQIPQKIFVNQNLKIQPFILTSISFQVKYCNTVLPTPKICDLQESTKKWKTFLSKLFSFKGGKTQRIISFYYNFLCCIHYSDNW